MPNNIGKVTTKAGNFAKNSIDSIKDGQTLVGIAQELTQKSVPKDRRKIQGNSNNGK